MYGIEEAYCDAIIATLCSANTALRETHIEEAIKPSFVRHKGDTLGIDQVPENTIAKMLLTFDPYSVLITEERGEEANPLARQTELTIRGPRTFFVCDPCDRSSEFCDFLEKNKEGAVNVADILSKENAKDIWQKNYGSQVGITGANSAITCVRRGLPICSVLLNLITQELTIACSAGIFQASLTDHGSIVPTMASIDRQKKLSFPNVIRDRNEFFVTFMGKPERGYPANFTRTKLAQESNQKHKLYYGKPGGPTRCLYLSDLQPEKEAVGYIVANGEKIGEWIHWLPFIRYANRVDDSGDRALQLFEVIQNESPLRDGYLMTPTEPYSVFKETSNGRQVIINVERLGAFANPSKYRATLLVTPATNEWAIGRARQFGYRPLVFFGD